MNRRRFLGTLGVAPLAQTQAAAPETRVYWNREPLAPNAYAPLPLGAIKPIGWLRRQLQIQASGLSGHIDEFWPDLGPNSGWLGGAGESWERGPYYLDGLIPLAFVLEDERLIAKAHKWVRWTLENQRPDGAIGPDRNRGKFAQSWQAEDWWPNMVMLKALTQYQEATGDPRVVPLMTRYLHYHLQHANQVPLVRWASFRWADQLVSLIWLYNRTGDAKLLQLARLLQAQSFDWKDHFANFRFTGKVSKPDAQYFSHVVNNAMAIKTSSVWWQMSRGESDRMAIYRLFEAMDRYHRQPGGVHSGDEHYAGLDPSQGTELCAVVEAMYSLEQLLAIHGDPAFADRLERIAYNALPATFDAKMWAHQYDQQANQVLCSIDKTRAWTTNGPAANIFGLEPNFGCCTSNMHQGWPKLVAHLWMAAPGGGLAAMAYGPCRVNTRIRGVDATIEEHTEYPFKGSIRLALKLASNVQFPLHLRIPAWAEGARIRLNNRSGPAPRLSSFVKIDRTWKSGDSVEIDFPMRLRSERHYRNSVAVLRGPLVFSLKIGEDWRKVRGAEPAADYEVHPTTPWNYGLTALKTIAAEERAVGEYPFSPEGAPVVLKARALRVTQWTLVNAAAGPLPESPIASSEPEETVTLIPYGSAKLRVTAFPEIAAPGKT